MFKCKTCGRYKFSFNSECKRCRGNESNSINNSDSFSVATMSGYCSDSSNDNSSDELSRNSYNHDSGNSSSSYGGSDYGGGSDSGGGDCGGCD